MSRCLCWLEPVPEEPVPDYVHDLSVPHHLYVWVDFPQVEYESDCNSVFLGLTTSCRLPCDEVVARGEDNLESKKGKGKGKDDNVAFVKKGKGKGKSKNGNGEGKGKSNGTPISLCGTIQWQ